MQKSIEKTTDFRDVWFCVWCHLMKTAAARRSPSSVPCWKCLSAAPYRTPCLNTECPPSSPPEVPSLYSPKAPGWKSNTPTVEPHWCLVTVILFRLVLVQQLDIFYHFTARFCTSPFLSSSSLSSIVTTFLSLSSSSLMLSFCSSSIRSLVAMNLDTNATNTHTNKGRTEQTGNKSKIQICNIMLLIDTLISPQTITHFLKCG